MRFLHVIKNWADNDQSVDLYITDSGEYVLEGDIFSIKIKFKDPSKMVSSMIDLVAYILNLVETYNYDRDAQKGRFVIYSSENGHLMNTMAMIMISMQSEHFLMWGEKDT